MAVDRISQNPELTPGSLLGPYELLTPIARGGMARVWAARRSGPRGFKKIVALKAMHPEVGNNPIFQKLFLAEAKLASRLGHPNVCVIHDFGEERGQLYLAMEWLDGQSLREIEEQYPEGLPSVLAARIAADVAAGLHAVHELRDVNGEPLGLVHCDVSPPNIVVTVDGVAKIVDFGVARATAAPGHDVPLEGVVGGKLSFMAPEQVQARPIDRRTDVFALGIVLYRLLTGEHPFRGETAHARAMAMLDPVGQVIAPHLVRPECSEALSGVVLRALEKDPSRRFETMDAFARALAEAVPEILTSACQDELSILARTIVREPAPSEPEPAPRQLPEVEPEPRPVLETIRPVSVEQSAECALRSRASSRTLLFAITALLGLSALAFVFRPPFPDPTGVASRETPRLAAEPARRAEPPSEPQRDAKAPAKKNKKKRRRAQPPALPPVPEAPTPAATETDWSSSPGF